MVVTTTKSSSSTSSGKKKKPQSNNTSKTISARERRQESRAQGMARSWLCCGMIACCLLVLLAVGLILAFVVFDVQNSKSKNSSNNNNNNTTTTSTTQPGGNPNGSPISPSAPSVGKFPTQSPLQSVPTTTGGTNPQPKPTMPPVMTPPTPNPVPKPTNPPVVSPTSELTPTSTRFVWIATADTYVNRDGFDKFESFGSDSSFLVQNGPASVNEIPDAFGLLRFDWTTTTTTTTTNTANNNLPSNPPKNVMLQLYHIPVDRNRGPATLTIIKMDPTPLNLESLHGGLVGTMDSGTVGPSFAVAPSDTIVRVDVTALYQPNEKELYIRIENLGIEQPAQAEGDRFRTRETNDPPQLIFYY